MCGSERECRNVVEIMTGIINSEEQAERNKRYGIVSVQSVMLINK